MKLAFPPFVQCLLVIGTLIVAAPAAQAQQGGGVGPNYETRLSAIEDQMRSLNGDIEQLGYSIKRIDQLMQRMQTDYDARLAKIETDMAALQTAETQQAQSQATAQAAAAAQTPAAAPPPPDQPVPEVKGTLGAVKVQNGKVVGGINNPNAPPLPDTPPDYGLTPQEQYERAFDILRKADYANAEKAFKAFIDKNPKDKLNDNAKYWYGETLYVQNKFNEAAVAFVDAYQQNPKGTKAPDSLLKLGLSLSALNKVPDACATLTELKAKYANAATNIRSRATEEIAKLKCGASP